LFQLGAADKDIAWGLDADSHLTPIDFDDGDDDFVADHESLGHFPGQYEHGDSLLMGCESGRFVRKERQGGKIRADPGVA
jgi:hypothetical protein